MTHAPLLIFHSSAGSAQTRKNSAVRACVPCQKQTVGARGLDAVDKSPRPQLRATEADRIATKLCGGKMLAAQCHNRQTLRQPHKPYDQAPSSYAQAGLSI